MNNIFNEFQSVRDVYSFLDKFKSKVAFVVDSKKTLVGSVTDGDVRRYILASGEINAELLISEVMNKDVFSVRTERLDKLPISQLLEKYGEIPVVDEHGVILNVLGDERTYFSLGDYWDTDMGRPFIIAEIGNNHQGELATAIALIDAVHEAGADCAKFQMRTMHSLYRDTRQANDLGAEYTLDLLSKFQLSDDELFHCFDYCRSLGMMPLCTPWDLESLEKLEGYGMEAYKVASADFTNYELLEKLCRTEKPLIISTGMSSELECIETINFLHKRTTKFVLLHCNSTYPTPFKDVNLSYIPRLRELSKAPVGYSGHERGTAVSIAAAALGAVVIEKHVTFDRSQEGNDHKVSLLPTELKAVVQGVKEVCDSIGTSVERKLTQGELINRENLAKSIIAARNISIGEVFTPELFVFRSPGQGLQPNRMSDLIGKKAQRNIEAGDFLFQSDIDEKGRQIQKFEFERPFGVPVRFGDFEEMKARANISFVEFHLSYQDLEVVEPIRGSHKGGISVHAPELFADDHLLDLASFDPGYRDKSVDNLQKTIAKANELKTHFSQEADPILIVNVGGWSQDKFLSKDEVEKKVLILKESLGRVNFQGVELSIQTMPPFPWHFGGQQYHNLFVSPEFIDSFCRETGLKICLDVSHSMMTCNYLNIDFIEHYLPLVWPHVNYMHIVDAEGVDGEGVQIGRGDVPFETLCDYLNQKLPNIPFVPEVWQGHKDGGLGFWEAMTFLENTGLR